MADDFFKDVFSDVRVDGREGVVQQVDVRLVVHCAGKTDSLLLTARQVYSLQGYRVTKNEGNAKDLYTGSPLKLHFQITLLICIILFVFSSSSTYIICTWSIHPVITSMTCPSPLFPDVSLCGTPTITYPGNIQF